MINALSHVQPLLLACTHKHNEHENNNLAMAMDTRASRPARMISTHTHVMITELLY